MEATPGTSVASREESLRVFIASARECFRRSGVEATRMEDVAQGAGLSRQYLYRLVSGRDELIELALIERCGEFTDELEARGREIAGGGELTEAFIDQIMFAISLGRYDEEFRALASALSRERLNKALTSADSPLHEFTRRALDPLFARAMDEGVLRTDVSGDAMVDWLQSVFALLAGRDDIDEEAERRLLRDFVVRGLFR